ncbi:MAG: hypothetical protein ACKO8P_07140, partial [Actinomycetota bacterium]
LESRMDSLDSRVDAVERQIVELRNEVRALGNLRHTIVLTGASLAISLFVGLGGLMVAIVQPAAVTGFDLSNRVGERLSRGTAKRTAQRAAQFVVGVHAASPASELHDRHHQPSQTDKE